MTSSASSAPPLSSLRVIELAGLAPGPYCGYLLAQYGASVLRIDRPIPPSTSKSSNSNSAKGGPANDILTAHKSSLPLNLKSATSHALLLKLLSTADVLIDPFRPGVLEKLGLDPVSVLSKLNPRLIVVRLTGFRKDGKYKDMAGHDINYLAVSGVLSLLGAPAHTYSNSSKMPPPIPPSNILADFAGGGLVAFTGILLALVARATNGNKGQVIDANMVDGVTSLSTFQRLLLPTPMWDGPRGSNTLDGGCPYYGSYECREPNTYVAVGALEPQFFAQLLKGLGLTEEDVVPEKGMSRMDKRSWGFMRGVFEQVFKGKTRREWEGVFEGTDACVTPVLTFGELQRDKIEVRPLVGLSGTPGREVPEQYAGQGLKVGDGGEEVLGEWLGWKTGKQWEVDQEGAAVLRKDEEMGPKSKL